MFTIQFTVIFFYLARNTMSKCELEYFLLFNMSTLAPIAWYPFIDGLICLRNTLQLQQHIVQPESGLVIFLSQLGTPSRWSVIKYPCKHIEVSGGYGKNGGKKSSSFLQDNVIPY